MLYDGTSTVVCTLVVQSEPHVLNIHVLVTSEVHKISLGTPFTCSTCVYGTSGCTNYRFTCSSFEPVQLNPVHSNLPRSRHHEPTNFVLEGLRSMHH